MSRPWEPEFDVTIELAENLINRQFPELRGMPVTAFSQGWDNTAFLVNTNLVFRFPHRQLGAECMDHEIQMLPQLAPHLNYSITNPHWTGRPSSDYPWSFAGYPLIPGQHVVETQLPPAARTGLAAALGKFLHDLHSLAGIRGPGDLIGRLDMLKRQQQIRKNLDYLQLHNVLPDPQPWRELLHDLCLLQPTTDCVPLHGDLYSLHVLLDDQQQLAGIIDWGDTHLGHPAIDLSIAWIMLPGECHEAFKQAYGIISDDTWQLARFRAFYHALNLAKYAEEIQHPVLLQESLFAIQNVL
ncbi:MAG: phosphotransferase [Pirellulaceae bacterium]|jgi:aminoglycoside phosphotransferase (APT) family kinase protein